MIVSVSGGMQDWNYLNTNCFEVTIELGCIKFPMAKDLPGYWEQNRRALLQFIHQVNKIKEHFNMFVICSLKSNDDIFCGKFLGAYRCER